jgi:diketogulonate reductase-like aldo/keto reductase
VGFDPGARQLEILVSAFLPREMAGLEDVELAAQVLLRWCVQRGIPVIATSTHRDRIAENAQVFDFELSAGDMEELDALDRSGWTQVALERKWW